MMLSREEITAYLKNLREEIILQFEALEGSKRFERRPWHHRVGGGGEIGLLRGTTFEKAAVNYSCIHTPDLYATGVSLITHMQNPHAPTVHMNVRYIEHEGKWHVGGGYDLTPMGFPYEEDTVHFHQVAKEAVKERYPTLKRQAAEYFYITHRQKERGVGGLFFDYEQDWDLWQACGNSFLEAILPIYNRRVHIPYTEEDRKKQAALRAHYVEFNLLYDRGTKFGFQTGGNPEAILCSMPPSATW